MARTRTRTRTRTKALDYSQRLALLGILGAAGAVLLLLRLFVLQVVEQGEMEHRAERMRLGWDAVLPRRGSVVDADGELLAVDAAGFDLGVKALGWRRVRFECTHCGRVYFPRAPDRLPSKCSRCRKQHPGQAPVPLIVPGPRPDPSAVAKELGITVRELTNRIEKRARQVEQRIERETAGLEGNKKRRREEDLWHDFGRRHRVLKREIRYEVVREIALHPELHPEFSIRTTTTRRYPGGVAFAHLLGRVSRVRREVKYELDEQGNRVGKTDHVPVLVKVRRDDRLDDPVREKESVVGGNGLEGRFEEVLKGKGGWVEVKRNPRTGERTVIDEERATDGATIQLTVAAEDQRRAYQALGREPGAFVIVNAETGAVLALVSSPSYDPHGYSDIFARWRLATDRSRSPLYDRAYSNPQIPGSILKPFTALAAARTGDLDLAEEIDCDRAFHINGRRLSSNRCAHHHGATNLHDGLVKSCNVYFQTLLDRMRTNDREDMFFVTGSAFGFGKATGLEIEKETVRDGSDRLGNWTPWGIVNPGTLVACGIGQGTVTTTPAQIARAYAGLATGYLPKLHLVRRVGDTITRPEREPLDLDPRTLAAIRRGLAEVSRPGGTAADYRLWRWNVSCKTGTAQTGRSRRGAIPLHHGWIAGYAPPHRNRPPIAFAMVRLDTPLGGATACGPRLEEFFAYFYAEIER